MNKKYYPWANLGSPQWGELVCTNTPTELTIEHNKEVRPLGFDHFTYKSQTTPAVVRLFVVSIGISISPALLVSDQPCQVIARLIRVIFYQVKIF